MAGLGVLALHADSGPLVDVARSARDLLKR
jgi:hypothetical protein